MRHAPTIVQRALSPKLGLGALVISGALVLPVSLLFIGRAGAASSAVGLGNASSFAVLAGAGVTNIGTTSLSGDIGSYPTLSISGTSTLTITGTNHGGDGVTQSAKVDLASAEVAAAAEGPTQPIAGDLGGRSLTAGVYNSSSSIGLTGTLTLDGGGNSASVFVFQAGSTLTTASASRVALINGAQACNVFWQIGSSATLGTGSSFVGSVLASSSVTVTTGVDVAGRVLASNGAVTLDTDHISVPACTTSSTGATGATGATGSTGIIGASGVTGIVATTSTTTLATSRTTTTSAPRRAVPVGSTTTLPTPVSFAKPPIHKVGFTG